MSVSGTLSFEMDTHPKISLNRFIALLQRRLPSHSRRVEQDALQRAERLDLLQSAVQLLQVGDIADPRLNAATVASFLDGIADIDN